MNLFNIYLIALIDSLNPSAIILTLYLLSTHKPVIRSFAYIFGIFITYFVIGILVALGLGNLISNIFSYSPGTAGYIIQAIIAVLMIYFGIRLKVESQDEALKHKPKSLNPIYTFIAGVTITFVESTTAVPYLAAIGTLSRANLELVEIIPILAIYNLIFVLPPLLLLLLYIFKRDKVKPIFAKIQQNISKWVKKMLRVVLIGLGILLILDTVGFFFGSPIF